MAFGLTSLGFIKKQLTDIKNELETAFRGYFGAGIRTDADSQFGKYIGIISERIEQIWSLAEAVYYSAYPNSASDVSLSRIGELTGIAPNAATKSTTTAFLAGTSAVLVPAGSIVATQDAGDQFETETDITLSAINKAVTSVTRSGSTVSVNAVGHGLSLAGFFFLNGADQVEYNGLHLVTNVVDANNFEYQISTTPTSPATGTIDLDHADAVTVTSIETGPIQALAGTLNQIITPVPNWTRVDNYIDATLGADAETDAAFRARRIAALIGTGSASIPALEGALLNVTGVSDAKGFENTGIVTDGAGRPPKSIEMLVVGGADADIRQKIYDKRSGGIETYGNVSGTVNDSQGNPVTIKFSRATALNIYLELDLTVDGDYPTDGDTQVENRILAFGDALTIGEDVIVYPSLVASFADVPGITDVVVRIGTAASPTLDDNIIVGDTQLADFDSTRITITST